MISLGDIQARFPGAFDSVSETLGALVIAEAGLYVNESKWGDLYDQGLLFLSAHLLSLSTGAGAAGEVSGPVTSRRVGDVSVTYASGAGVSSSSSSFGETSYGRRFLELRLLVCGGPLVPTL